MARAVRRVWKVAWRGQVGFGVAMSRRRRVGCGPAAAGGEWCRIALCSRPRASPRPAPVPRGRDLIFIILARVEVRPLEGVPPQRRRPDGLPHDGRLDRDGLPRISRSRGGKRRAAGGISSVFWTRIPSRKRLHIDFFVHRRGLLSTDEIGGREMWEMEGRRGGDEGDGTSLEWEAREQVKRSWEWESLRGMRGLYRVYGGT